MLTVDARNHGDSEHIDDMSYPLMAADIVGLLDSLGIYDAHVLGHSMGGRTAMTMALQYVSLCPIRNPTQISCKLDSFRSHVAFVMFVICCVCNICNLMRL